MDLINLSLLKDAKAYLCWDVFPHLAIQLVAVQNAVAFYYPPDHNHAIVVFYSTTPASIAEAFYLLFHEAGHVAQRQQFDDDNRAGEFAALLNLDRGEAKQQFERQAWNFGRDLLQRFLSGKEIAAEIVLTQYELYADKSIYTYREE